MMSKNNRPQGMSQLDYLWLNFGGYLVGTSPSSTPQQNVVLSELAVTSLIKNATNGGILSLEYIDHPTDDSLMRLIGKSVDGQIVSFVDMPKEVRVQSFVGRTVNSLDIENGCPYPFGDKVLSIVLTNGKEFLVSLNSLGLVLTGAETKTSVSEIIDGKVYNHVKIDKVSLSVVELRESTYGLSAHLNISPDETGVKLSKADNGLKAQIPLGSSGKYIKFDRISLNTYMALANKDDYTVYFITDKPYIFVGSQKYGVDIDSVGINSLEYDNKTMELTYRTSEGSKSISLGPVSSTENGMMTSTDYVELYKLKTALDGITTIKEYILLEVDKLGATIGYGEIIENKRPLYLKNTKGDILSTVWTDVETYLASSTSRLATAEDVELSAQAGITLQEGDRIIILSLTNGDKHYVKLQDVVISQSFANSKTINFLENNGVISADLNLSDNNIIYITEDGLSANILIIRDGNMIKVYGHTIDDTKVLGKFMSPTKELQSTLFVSNITEEQLAQYPPTLVNWKDSEEVVLGNDYYLLFYKDYNNDLLIYYISIAKPTISIAEIEGNLLKLDENGDLYVLLEWIESN